MRKLFRERSYAGAWNVRSVKQAPPGERTNRQIFTLNIVLHRDKL
jgi:hypothetical protein